MAIVEVPINRSLREAVSLAPDGSTLNIEAGVRNEWIQMEYRHDLDFQAIGGEVHVQPNANPSAFFMLHCTGINFSTGFKATDAYAGSVVQGNPHPQGELPYNLKHAAGFHMLYCKGVTIDSPKTADCNIGIMLERCYGVKVLNPETHNSGEAGIRNKQSDNTQTIGAISYRNGFPTNRVYSAGSGGHGIITYKGLNVTIKDCILYDNFQESFYVYEGTNPRDEHGVLMPTHFLTCENNEVISNGNPMYLSVYERDERTNVFSNNRFLNTADPNGVYLRSGRWFDVLKQKQIEEKTVNFERMCELFERNNPRSIGNTKIAA